MCRAMIRVSSSGTHARAVNDYAEGKCSVGGSRTIGMRDMISAGNQRFSEGAGRTARSLLSAPRWHRIIADLGQTGNDSKFQSDGLLDDAVAALHGNGAGVAKALRSDGFDVGRQADPEPTSVDETSKAVALLVEPTSGKQVRYSRGRQMACSSTAPRLLEAAPSTRPRRSASVTLGGPTLLKHETQDG